ncbi:MAG: hypothetical protein WBI17_10955 [Clostridiaceae bacterium]
MKIKSLAMVFLLIIISLSAACTISNDPAVFPPEKGEELTFKTTSLVYQNSGSTSYALGGVASIFTFTDDSLSIKDDESIKIYDITYEKANVTLKDFEKQLENTDKIPDFSSYRNFTQYNIVESKNDSPGYRLYLLDDEYWIGTLYKGALWRVVSLDIDK